MPALTSPSTSTSQRRPRYQLSASPSSHSSHEHACPRSSRSASPTTSSSDSRFSTYTPTTVSSYERRRSNAEIAGLPDRKYFSSGKSKIDRRREYVEPPLAQGREPSSSPASAATSRNGGGKALVKYHPWANGSGEVDSNDETATLLPSDSISQGSYTPSSSSSSRKRRDSGFGGGSSGGSTFSSLSTFQSEQVFDGRRKCYIVERRPRASAMVW